MSEYKRDDLSGIEQGLPRGLRRRMRRFGRPGPLYWVGTVIVVTVAGVVFIGVGAIQHTLGVGLLLGIDSMLMFGLAFGVVVPRPKVQKHPRDRE